MNMKGSSTNNENINIKLSTNFNNTLVNTNKL